MTTVCRGRARRFVDLQKHFFPGDTGVTVCQYPNGKLANGMQYQVSIAGHTSVTWYTWHLLPDMTPAA